MSPTSFDYIIVGAGSAGSTLAARLSENPEVQVAVLEAGPIDNNVLIHCPMGLALLAKNGQANWKFSTVPQPGLNGRCGYQPRGKVVGGSSSVNAMIYIRGQQEDYDYWAAEGNPGWSFKDVLPYFKKAEGNSRGADAWHGDSGPLHVQDLTSPNPLGPLFVKAGVQAGYRFNPDFNAASQEGIGPYQVTHKNGERHSAAKGYLTPHLDRPNLTLITDAHTCKIVMEKKQAVGVEYLHQGQMHTLRARKEVLLCAGALQSPQLLMLSGIGPKAHLLEHGIVPVHDLPGVGENLHDHPDIVQLYNVPQATESIAISWGGIMAAIRGIFEWRNQRTGMLTSNAAEAGGFVKSQPGEPTPDLQLHFVVGKLVNHGRTTVFGHGYSCHLCVLRPRSRGNVRLASSNPLEAPRIDPNFFGDRDDMDRMVRGFKIMRNILNQPALKSLGGSESPKSAAAQTDLEIENFIRENADTIYHPVGSCRMGPGPMDVVDAELRVHGIQGLRVVDASIMPRVVSGNTNGPVVMIAEKAADMILQGGQASTATPQPAAG